MIAGVLTANELALLRTRPQRTLLYLAIPEYKTIYTARVNGTPASNDNTYQIIFDGGVGALADVEPGMTLLVGTAAGAWDIGIARIRKTPIANLFYIGITSELDLADNQYLTVIDDIGLWPKHPYINAAGTMFIDYDVAYTNQNQAGAPVPIIGTHAVLELTGASVSCDFDASDSYNAIGVPTAYTYAWYVDGVLAGNAAAITLTFTTVGTYLIKLEITSAFSFCTAGQESVAYRYVIVHDCQNPLNSSFVLDSCSGSFSEGGWSYRVTMNAKASETYVRDRTLCLLVARDYYDDTEQSIGPLEGRENIIAVGWVDGESLRRSNDKSMVSFEIQGPHFWLAVQEGFPTGVDDTNVAPTDWAHIQELTPRKGLFAFLHWRTTSTVVMDCYITADDHRLATTYTPAGSLMEQLRAIAERVNAYTVCDRYGRLHCQIDTQFLTPILRTFPVVQTLGDRDWRDEITIERRTVETTGQVDLSGVYYSGDLTTSNAIFALSPGHYPKHYGGKRQIPRIALDDQAEANTVAGLWAGYLNNEYPNIDVPFSSNHRGIDIAPRMFVQMNLLAGDTPRGIEWQLSFVTAPKKLIPRDVSYGYDTRNALLLTDVTFEAETFASDAVIGDPPISPPDPPPPPGPPTYCDDITALNYGLEGDCVYASAIDLLLVYNRSQMAVSRNALADEPTVWTSLMVDGLIGANIGYIYGACVLETGEAYCITYKDEATLADNGLWYCADVLAPSWVLIYTPTQLRADVGDGLGGPSLDALFLLSLATHNPAATAFATFAPFYRGTFEYGYVDCAAGVATWTPTSPATPVYQTGFQFTCHYNQANTTDRFGLGHPAVPNTARVFDIDTSGITRWLNGGREMDCATQAWAVIDNNSLFPYTLGVDVPLGTLATYTQHTTSYPIDEAGGHVFWHRNTDNALMIDAAIQAIPNDAGGVTGVFSNAGATGAGFIVIGTSATILWVASSAAVNNAYRSIAVTQDGGVTWRSLDGDWAAKLGAVWAGSNVPTLPYASYAQA